VAVARGDEARGGRLWGLARQLERVSGTALAAWDEAVFANLPSSPRARIAPLALEAFAAQGAALPLADGVAYALGETDPFAVG
jgi:hypothetical protein